MDDAVQNIIRTQRVEVEFENPDNAFESRKRLTAVCKDRLIPAIEVLFEQLVTDDIRIQIDTLKIDVGSLEKDNWEDEFVNNSVKQLEVFLKQHLSEHSLKQTEGLHKENVSARYEKEQMTYVNKMIIGNDREKHQTLIHYFKTGLLTWNSPAMKKEEFKKYFAESLNDPSFVSKLTKELQTDLSLLERMIYLMNKETLFDDFLLHNEVFELLKKWLLTKTEVIKTRTALVKEIERLFLKKDFFDRIYKEPSTLAALIYISPKKVEQYFSYYLKKIQPPSLVVFNKCLTALLPMKSFESVFILVETFVQEQEKQLSEIFQLFVLRIKNEFPSLFHQNSFVEKINLITDEFKFKADMHSVFDNLVNKPKDEEIEQGLELLTSETTNDSAATREDKLFIENAGLVLLHPFLDNFFRSLNLTNKEKKWISKDTQEQAVLILQYLANGEISFLENDFVLNKIICGYPLIAPIALGLNLSASITTETKDLLNAVIGHWAVLQGTSVDGLRETFLMRNGKLEKKEYGWKLIVEQKGVDVLLNSLPWSFKNIHTPWMNKNETIIVDWI